MLVGNSAEHAVRFVVNFLPFRFLLNFSACYLFISSALLSFSGIPVITCRRNDVELTSIGHRFDLLTSIYCAYVFSE